MKNQQLNKLSGTVHTLLQQEYINVNWSHEESTQRTVSKEAIETIDVTNNYTRQVITNNRKMVSIIRDKFWMAEPDDYIHFDAMIEDITRIDIELDEELRGKLPLRIVLKQDRIHFTRGDTLNHLVDKFAQKRKKLDYSTSFQLVHLYDGFRRINKTHK